MAAGIDFTHGVHGLVGGLGVRGTRTPLDHLGIVWACLTINPELASSYGEILSEALLRRRDQCAPRMVLRNTPAVDIHFAKPKLRLGIAFVGEWRQ